MCGAFLAGFIVAFLLAFGAVLLLGRHSKRQGSSQSKGKAERISFDEVVDELQHQSDAYLRELSALFKDE